jgi:hypothetical protein
MGVHFESLGHVAEALAWRITVKDGIATLSGEAAGAWGPRGDESGPFECEYTADELRDLAALFTGAADLLDGKPAGLLTLKPSAELTADQVDALPIGAKVKDMHGDVWTRFGGDEPWALGSREMGGDSTSAYIHHYYRPITLLSVPAQSTKVCEAHGAHPHGGRRCLDCPVCASEQS